MYPLPSGFGFKDVAIGMAAVLKVEMPLPVFPVEAISEEEASHFLAKVQTDAERVLGSYGPREHVAYVTLKLTNGGHLNRIFEKMGIPYATRPYMVPKLPSWQQGNIKMMYQRKSLPKSRRLLKVVRWPR
jgi:hypothetical protein